MNPELTPPFGVRNAGSPLYAGLTRRSIRLSATLANSDSAIFKKSKLRAIGCPWKFPPEIPALSSLKMIGLSVTELISIFTCSFT